MTVINGVDVLNLTIHVFQYIGMYCIFSYIYTDMTVINGKWCCKREERREGIRL